MHTNMAAFKFSKDFNFNTLPNNRRLHFGDPLHSSLCRHYPVLVEELLTACHTDRTNKTQPQYEQHVKIVVGSHYDAEVHPATLQPPSAFFPFASRF